jgi:Ser/Thr protein kinase RdoA (MazF antagonist)
MFFCDKNEIKVPVPLHNLEEECLKRIEFKDGTVRTVRLLRFISGELFLNVTPTPSLLYQAGAFVRHFSLIFQVF